MNKNVWVWVVGLLLLGVSSVTAYSTYCIVLSNNTICFNDSGITGVSNITATNINASDVLNAPWLVASDQRYNDTALILAVQQSLSGNSSALLLEIQNRIGNDTYLNNLKLNITDQRFNDSALISAVQQSVSGNASSLTLEIQNRIGNDSLKLNVTDQRYNDTVAINNVQSSVSGNATSLTNEISARQSIGNWSNDKNSYNTTVQLLTLFYLQSNPYNFLNSTTIPVYNNLSMANVVSGVGNWSGDKPSYNTTSELNNLFYLKSNPFGFYNSSTIPAIGTNMSLVVSGVGNWSADKNLYNTTSENYNIFLNVTDQRYNDTVAINNVQNSVSGNASLLTLEIQSRQGNDSAYITAVNNSLVLETQSRVGNDSLKANLVGNNAFVGTNEFTGTTYINTTLNIKDGAGANGTTIQGNTIWTGTLFVVNISQATIVPAINVNGSYLPLLSDTFYLGNNTRIWKEIWGTTFYENGISLNSKYNYTSAISSIGNWTKDKPNYITNVYGNSNYVIKWKNNTDVISSTIYDDGNYVTVYRPFIVNDSIKEYNISLNTLYNDTSLINLVNDSRTSNDTALGNRITTVNSTVNSIGNWTNDKSSYALISMVNLVNDSRTSNDTVLGNRITTVNSTVNSIGNWTNDKPSYKAIGTFTTHSAINITGGDINMSNTGSCLYLPGGGRICGNTTTVSIIAP